MVDLLDRMGTTSPEYPTPRRPAVIDAVLYGAAVFLVLSVLSAPDVAIAEAVLGAARSGRRSARPVR